MTALYIGRKPRLINLDGPLLVRFEKLEGVLKPFGQYSDSYQESHNSTEKKD